MKLSPRALLQTWRTRQIISRLLKESSEVKLEIGAGQKTGTNGWTTLDLWGADLSWDLNDPLPFPDNSVAKIYSSHALEHFWYSDLIRLLRDCRRILKPRGVISVCVPDASIYVHGYLNAETFDRDRYLTWKPAVVPDSNARMDILNYTVYMDGVHRYMFDGENLQRVLSTAGFVSVRLREFEPELDLEERRYESVYAVGEKP